MSLPLQIASGVTSILGLTAIFGVLYLWVLIKQQESSIYRTIRGEDCTTPDSVVKILMTFKDDKDRLKALTSLLKGDEKKSQQIISKVEPNLDASQSKRHQIKVLLVTGLFFLLLALLAIVTSIHQRIEDKSLSSKINYIRTAELIDEIDRTSLDKLVLDKEIEWTGIVIPNSGSCDYIIKPSEKDTSKNHFAYVYLRDQESRQLYKSGKWITIIGIVSRIDNLGIIISDARVKEN